MQQTSDSRETERERKTQPIKKQTTMFKKAKKKTIKLLDSSIDEKIMCMHGGISKSMKVF